MGKSDQAQFYTHSHHTLTAIITFDRNGGFRSDKVHFKAQNILEITCVIIFGILQNIKLLSNCVNILLGQPV